MCCLHVQIEAARHSEISLNIYQTTRCDIPEDVLYSYNCGNLISHNAIRGRMDATINILCRSLSFLFIQPYFFFLHRDNLKFVTKILVEIIC
jgi:hypothetical protein